MGISHLTARGLLDNQIDYLRRAIAEHDENIVHYRQTLKEQENMKQEKEQEIRILEQSINALVEAEVLGTRRNN